MTISYGKGRVFHTTMGHDAESMKDVGFVTTLNRGAEWAATGRVTIPSPPTSRPRTKSVCGLRRQSSLVQEPEFYLELIGDRRRGIHRIKLDPSHH